MRVIIGATTAEKLDGTSGEVDYRSPLSSFILSPSTLIAPPLQFQPFPFLFLFPLPLNVRLGKALYAPHIAEQKWQQVAKVGEDSAQLVLTFSEVGGDASHESHKAFAPTRTW